MESQLAVLEQKIDNLLASVDLPNKLVPVPTGEGLRNDSEESGDASSENKRLEKGEEASGNKTEKSSK